MEDFGLAPQRPASASTKTKASWRRRVVTLLGIGVITLLLAEGALRVRQRLVFGTWSPTVYEFQTDPVTGLRMPIPGSKFGPIPINEDGYRGAVLSPEKPPGTLRAVFLGGSTTFCAEVSDESKSWPHLVVAALRAAKGTAPIDFLNAGIPGFTTEELLTTLEKRVAALHPDLIVIYEATNDLARDSRMLAQEKGVYRGSGDEPSWLADRSVLWNLIEKNVRVRSRQQSAAAGEAQLEFDPARLAARYKERLRSLVNRAKSEAGQVALVTFSPRVRREQDAATRLAACNTALFYMPYMNPASLLDAFDAYNSAAREVAREAQVLLVDDPFHVPSDDDHYNDSVHFRAQGCIKMAERVSRVLLADPEFRKRLGLP